MWLALSRSAYTLSLQLYTIGVRVAASLWKNQKARQWLDGRKAAFAYLRHNINEHDQHIWFHCASLGEFEQGRPLIEQLKTRFPSYKIVLTFFSPSGYEVRKNYDKAELVCYLPMDSKSNAAAFIGLVQPRLAVFIKYEFWYHYLTQLKNQGIPAILISATFRRKQPFFQWYGSLWRRMLSCYSFIFVQDESSIELLHQIEMINCAMAFDTRFDRVFAVYKAKKDLPLVEAFCDGKVLVAGSTWPKDEALLRAIMIEEPLNRKYIIAPHNLSETGLAGLQESLSGKSIRYSVALSDGIQDQTILIIDNIGMLSSLYGYGDVAFIGGGFGASVHNILEAAVYGMPVIFGPNHEKSVEALDLLYLGGAFSVHNKEDLHEAMRILSSEEAWRKASEVCKKYVADRIGGTQIIMDYLNTQNLINNF